MDAAAARKEEILAKKAKLEELRRTRVLREQELKKSKQDATTGTGTIGTSNRIAYRRGQDRHWKIPHDSFHENCQQIVNIA